MRKRQEAADEKEARRLAREQQKQATKDTSQVKMDSEGLLKLNILVYLNVRLNNNNNKNRSRSKRSYGCYVRCIAIRISFCWK